MTVPSDPLTLVEQATWAMWRAAGSPNGTAKREPYRKLARTLDAAGLLADPAAILLRLAELTAQAGKARSTEWLRTCATLPPDQWPPAPAYKGPMVPAAEHEQLQTRYEELSLKIGVDAGREYVRALKLQTRIDKAFTLLDEYDGYGAGLAFHDSLRAALQGAQPAEDGKPFGVQPQEAVREDSREFPWPN